MKAISMWQPHGSLLTTGAKPFETRSWETKFRGPILIHAAKHFNVWEWDHYLNLPSYRMGLAPLLGKKMVFVNGDPDPAFDPGPIPWEIIPLGAFIGMAELVDCIPTEKMTPAQKIRARGFGDFSAGRFAWEMAGVKRFKTPITSRGYQRLFYAHIALSQLELIPAEGAL
jgi:hypothetical protein